MAVRFKKRAALQKTFIKQWREHRELSQDQLADKMGALSENGDFTGASVSRVENGITAYTQDFLEVAAEVLECTVADLLERDPRKPFTPVDQAIALLQRTQTGR